MTRSAVGVALAALALSFGGVTALSFGGVTSAEPVPGPKQPPEHAAISGGFFQVKSGNPGCFSGAGTLGAPFPVPGGAVVTGATVYAIDSQASANISAALNKHDMISGGTFELVRGNTAGATGTVKLELVVPGGGILTAGQAINMSVSVGNGTCLKGAEVHYFRSSSTTEPTPNRRAPAHWYSPAGEPE